jgi:hypothetical protein
MPPAGKRARDDRKGSPPASSRPAAGYSGTPLWKKLGYAPGTRALAVDAPGGYARLLSLPPEVKVSWLGRPERGMRFVHVFAKESTSLQGELARLRREIVPDGVVWVSWPKRASGVPTDITEDTIREIAIPLGFVDIKVCAVDKTWSGLKLMIRRTER